MKKTTKLLVLVLALLLAFSFGFQSIAFAADTEQVADDAIVEPEILEAPELPELTEEDIVEFSAENTAIELEEALAEDASQVAASSFEVYTHSSKGISLIYTGTDAEVVFPATYNGQKVFGVRGVKDTLKQLVKSVKIEEGITYIDSKAFENCNNLESVTMPEGLLTVGYDAFSGCTALKSISFPKSTEKVEFGMFKNCVALTKVVVPNKATDIYTYSSMFLGCKASNIWIHGVPGSNAEKLAVSVGTKFRSLVSFKPSPPKNLELAIPYGTYNQVDIVFDQTAYCQKYELYRSTNKTKGYKLIKTLVPGTSTKMRYTDTKAEPGRTYYYKVRGVSNYLKPAVKSNFSNPRAVKPSLKAPSLYGTVSKTVARLNWSKVNGAHGYYVYRSDNGGAFARVALLGANTLKLEDRGFSTVGKLTYKIEAFRTIDGKNYAGPTDSVYYVWK